MNADKQKSEPHAGLAAYGSTLTVNDVAALKTVSGFAGGVAQIPQQVPAWAARLAHLGYARIAPAVDASGLQTGQRAMTITEAGYVALAVVRESEPAPATVGG